MKSENKEFIELVPDQGEVLKNSTLFREIQEEFIREQEEKLNRRNERPKCRFLNATGTVCNGTTRPLDNNGVCGPGYSEWNFVCIDCGRVQ